MRNVRQRYKSKVSWHLWRRLLWVLLCIWKIKHTQVRKTDAQFLVNFIWQQQHQFAFWTTAATFISPTALHSSHICVQKNLTSNVQVKTSTLSQRKDRAPQPSTFSCQAGGGGGLWSVVWGGSVLWEGPWWGGKVLHTNDDADVTP